MPEMFGGQLAAAVRTRRSVLRLSQQDVANMAGVSERFVRFVEQGKPSIQLDSLLAVLDTLGLELKLGTRSRDAAHALVPQPTSAVPRTDVPPSAVPRGDAAPAGSAGGPGDNRP